MLVKLAKLVVPYMPTPQADLAMHIYAMLKAMQHWWTQQVVELFCS